MKFSEKVVPLSYSCPNCLLSHEYNWKIFNNETKMNPLNVGKIMLLW